MCVKLPSLFTKAYNRMLLEQHCQILQGRADDNKQDNVFEYGTFSRASEWVQLQSDMTDVPNDLKNQEKATEKTQNFKQARPLSETESTAITKNILSRPSAREVFVQEYATPAYYLQKPPLEEASHIKTTQSSEERPQKVD